MLEKILFIQYLNPLGFRFVVTIESIRHSAKHVQLNLHRVLNLLS